MAYQFLDASILSDYASGSVELGHVGNSLSSQALETTVGGLQYLN